MLDVTYAGEYIFLHRVCVDRRLDWISRQPFHVPELAKDFYPATHLE